MRRSAAIALLVPTLLVATLLVGCTSTGPIEPPASSEAVEPTRAPDAAADQDLDAFSDAIAGHSPADPDALVAAVEAAGFARSSIERTREVDSLGAPVTLLQIAVRSGDGCIVGQVGDGEPMAVRAAVLGGGRCLVGETVALD